mmetsp:Transcript_23520/g.37474  ORF Transcript_23520/g.37474 Transcript_23520/m.37474 type:complete len:85 (-) Transcript_23520:168-422(-)
MMAQEAMARAVYSCPTPVIAVMRSPNAEKAFEVVMELRLFEAMDQPLLPPQQRPQQLMPQQKLRGGLAVQGKGHPPARAQWGQL